MSCDVSMLLPLSEISLIPVLGYVVLAETVFCSTAENCTGSEIESDNTCLTDRLVLLSLVLTAEETSVTPEEKIGVA